MSTRSGLIVKGHGRLLAAELEEFKVVPVEYQNYESDEAELADLTADNRIAELAEMDTKMLTEIFADIDTGAIDFELSGYTEQEYEDLATALTDAISKELNDPDTVIEPPADPFSKRGDIWILGGRHRVMCGDSTSEKDKAALLNGAQPQILLTDPPYCSGGFQESGKGTGSIGTDRDVTIANDTLSTRGYQSLMRNVIDGITPLVAYVFTDWRMWVNLFDIVEAAGFGVRSMLVWDKKTPGMGFGWRAQHELILYGQRCKAKWDNHKGYGNVLSLTRSGNELHPTQKPVELIEMLLDNTSWLEGVYDPFGGSGTTLIAAETKGQTAYLMELTPAYTDTIVKRWMKATGSQNIKCIRNGEQLSREEIGDIFEE